jgi:diadenosine tetraphosphate (Ap4A) HIT family hydrolase
LLIAFSSKKQTVKMKDMNYKSMAVSSQCIFCQNVISGREAFIFYKNERIMGFMDRYPVEEGHALIIPIVHYENIFHINREIFLEINDLGRYVSRALMDVFRADGINIGQNNGECARQVVMHYHLHIIPRYCGRELNWGRIKITEKQLEDHSKRIEKRLKEIMDTDILERDNLKRE